MSICPSVFSGGAAGGSMVFGKAGTAQLGFFFQELPTGVYFDNIRLENPEPFWEDRSPIVNVAELLTGHASVQSTPDTFTPSLRVAFRCQTTIHGNISLLLAKIGAPYTLKIDEFTYENCHISSFKENEWYPGEFEYTISFVQDTA